jgi:mRNA-degrading endonuclease RelE of RelBE toxin-antitoxin system
VKEIEWAEAALDDMAALDKGIARRIKEAVERFAATGIGNVKKLQGVEPAEFRLRTGDYRVRFLHQFRSGTHSPCQEPAGSLPLRRLRI